jgi:hypothetical protein
VEEVAAAVSESFSVAEVVEEEADRRAHNISVDR